MLKTIKQRLNKIVLKKNKGLSDLITSLVVILALIMIIFLALGVVTDVQKITAVDQVARQAIIMVESNGYLDQATLNSIKSNLEGSCNATFTGSRQVNSKTIQDGVYMVYNNGSTWEIATNIDGMDANTKKNCFGYGKAVGIYIQCDIDTTGIQGGVMVHNKKEKVARLKTSISKKLI